jgi:hypothetical protein
MKLINLRQVLNIKTAYNLLVQMDYLVGLTTAYLLGAGRWLMFFAALAISLILGFTTVLIYIRMLKSIVKEANND